MENAHSNSAPGPVGRIARIVFGAFLAAFAAFVLIGWAHAFQHELTPRQAAFTPYVEKQNVGLYLVALLAVLFLPVWNRRGRFGLAVILVVVAIALDYLLAGNWWGLPLAVLLSVMVIGILLFLAFAHVFAGIIANPG